MLHLSSTLSFSLLSRPFPSLPYANSALQLRRSHLPTAIRCASSDASGNKVSSRLSQVQHLLQQAEHRALSADNGPIPKITLGAFFLHQLSHFSNNRKKNKKKTYYYYLVSDHVTVNFARSGGPGGQNVNKG